MTRRHPTNRDANHAELTARYESWGCSVQDTSMVGGGFPDAVVGINTPAGRVNELVEFKNTEGRNRDEKSQLEFDETWRGRPRVIVHTIWEVDAHVVAIQKKPRTPVNGEPG